ncbi:MAG: hypothetical protein FWF01_01600 [Alphaproteobacteria bacterium]|nr:hypothetical protein [Alphaproteobacteria bacterium]
MKTYANFTLTFMDRLMRLKRSLNGSDVKIEMKPKRIGPTLKEMLEMLDKREPFKPLRKDGRCIFLYIPDLGTNEGTKKDQDQDEWNKVHLTYCNILQNMENAGREDRYEATESTSGEFTCVYQDGEVTKKRLHVCKYCMDAIESSERYGSCEHFDFEDFANDHNFEGLSKVQ